jgi:ATP-dependent Zn protease
MVCFGETSPENDDSEHAAQLVNELDLYVDKHIDSDELMLERLQAQASTLLAENWDAVQAVARALLETGTLTGGEVCQLMAASRIA